jgi:hypothetical protein
MTLAHNAEFGKLFGQEEYKWWSSSPHIFLSPLIILVTCKEIHAQRKRSDTFPSICPSTCVNNPGIPRQRFPNSVTLQGKNASRSSCKVPITLVRFRPKIESVLNFSKNPPMSNLMKIRSPVLELLRRQSYFGNVHGEWMLYNFLGRSVASMLGLKTTFRRLAVSIIRFESQKRITQFSSLF